MTRSDARLDPEEEAFLSQLLHPGVPPRTDATAAETDAVEATLLQAWRAVFGEAVQPQDNYFALGGDSLRSIQISARAARAGLRVAMQDIVEHPTVRELAACLRERGRREEEPGAAERPARERHPQGWTYPSTAAQEGLLFHSLAANGGSVPYVSQFSCILEGPLRPELLREATELLVARHPALRACFPEDLRARHRQLVADRAPIEWLSETAPQPFDAAAREALLAEEGRPFDLGRPGLLRVRVLSLGPERHLWIWTQHHLVADGESQERLLRELSDLYGRLCAGGPVDATEDPGYGAALLRIAGLQARGTGFDWRGYLAHLDAPAVPPLAADTPGGGSRELSYEFPAHEVGAMGSELAAAQLTAASAALSCFLLALAATFGRRDLIAGLVLSGRSSGHGHSGAVGNLVNTLPVRATFNRGRSLAQWMSAMQARVAQLQEHDDAALPDIRRAIRWPADRALFHSLFVHEHYRAPEELFGESLALRVRECRFTIDEGYPVVLVCDTAHGLRLLLRHSPAAVAHGTAADLLARVVSALRGLSRAADVDVLAFLERLSAVAKG